MNSEVSFLASSLEPEEENKIETVVNPDGFYGEAKGMHFGLVSWDECFDFADDGLEYQLYQLR